MPLRPARYSDITTLATLCSASFFDEDLFGQVMHPRRHEFPDDPALYWHQHIQNLWFDWRNQPFVAVMRDEKDGQEKIVGVAVWQRQGEGGKNMALSNVDPRNLALPFVKLIHRLTSLLYPNRALDASKANLLSLSVPYSKHHWDGERQENWYLSLLAVHPDYQGKGFGRELVEWGLQQAQKENVHASVMSSEGNDAFYLRSGFEQVVGNATEGEGNPLAGIKGGSILFKYPKRS
ncbi:acyl-CoA N-acyltransferase [Melanomma pulvis-pyrius CBS 109.77]|uniref:Acyl-CoA N-acyltransferase n=1 Tax=Melanomma pulvis-pyrius CBS 109.77 TaxID=1314802 RepID=A0A6A6XLK5_9PLEO|nr:acyl-CoA N-acyltransferase [Melanomma pulvis-pyrius CBS 109.77]